MTQKINIVITPYTGFEDAVLQVHNRNRKQSKEIKYLNWRYTAQNCLEKPRIFWIRTSNEKIIGMAGIVFRPYYIAHKKHYFAILGDISLDQEYRGHGIAQVLFNFINGYLSENKHICSFVMPNNMAEKPLSKCNWKVINEMTPFVFMIDPSNYFLTIFKFKRITQVLGKIYTTFIKLKLLKEKTQGFSIVQTTQFDATFNDIWSKMDRSNYIIRDRNTDSLNARYIQHPDSSIFRICKFFKNNDFIGYGVFNISKLTKICKMYEFILIDKKFINPTIYLLLKFLIKKSSISALRITLNKDHPYSYQLNKIGFKQRSSTMACQIYAPDFSVIKRSNRWFLTIGDKDI